MLKPGMIISDRYEIIDIVGSGGMADVFKAKCHRLNRFVAIKVLKPEYSSDKSFVNKFRGEAQSAAGLSHPNIVNVYDVGDDGGLHYIVMELVEGITLKRFIEKKGKLEVKEAVGIAIQIAQGMEAAHDNHIIHRDIKPQNIIISRDGKVKVTDFGIAKATNSNTITSNAMGSVHYLSPEQARGGYSDEKSDIYSLGVTLYEMLSGKVPFAGDNTVSVALLHIQGEPMPLRELDSRIPVSVDKIVMKCMQKRPERRYHSASELILDLKRAIANPDGDFVQIPAFVASDSPTINISDDLDRIKNGNFRDNSLRDINEPTKNLVEDDDDLDTVDSKIEKFYIVGYIAAAIILALLIIFLVIKFVFPNGGKNPIVEPTPEPTNTVAPSPTTKPTDEPVEPTGATYKVPSVVGLTFEDAEAAIKVYDPDAFVYRQENNSDTIKEGQVMEQYPPAGNDAVLGQQIILTISLGPQAFEIPYVYNLTEEQAEKKLEDHGLNVVVDYANSDIIAEGKVISTNPPKESLVVKGDTVTILISTGPENTQVVVPLITNQTEANAKQMLEDLGLVLGTVTPEASETVPEGLVISQSTTAGIKVDKGTKIDVSISTGPSNTQTGGSGIINYVATVVIDKNPMENMAYGEAEIVVEMVQAGEKSIIYEGLITNNDFPLIIEEVYGIDQTPGVVTMYVDGFPFTDGNSLPYTWTVEFDAVEE